VRRRCVELLLQNRSPAAVITHQEEVVRPLQSKCGIAVIDTLDARKDLRDSLAGTLRQPQFARASVPPRRHGSVFGGRFHRGAVVAGICRPIIGHCFL